MPTIVATAGAANANSYALLAEIASYHEARLALDPAWVATGSEAEALAIMATRVLEAMFATPVRRKLYLDGRGGPQGRPYYITSPAWTGEVATTTQALSWPRTGMTDRLGRAIPENVVPAELKEAQAELAGQLKTGDRTLDLAAAVEGISEVKAGSVAVKFASDLIAGRRVIPDAVLTLIPASWLTDEIVTPAVSIEFRAL